MRVALVADGFAVRGGAEQYAARVGELLAARGHDVVRVEAADVAHRVPRADVAFVQNVADVTVLERLVESLPTVQFLHDYRWTSPSETRFYQRGERICERRFGLGCVAHGYVDHCRNRRPDRVWESQRRVARWLRLQPALARVVVASEYVAAVTAAEGVRRAAIEVLPYFVELPPMRPVARADPPVVAYVGRLAQAKGVHTLIRASARLGERHRLVLAGDGYYRRELESLAARLGVPAEFVGWLERGGRDSLLAGAAVAAMPSLWPECFGLAGLEALAVGTPVVAADVGGIPEWLDPEVGTLVPAGDVDALSRALAAALAAPRTDHAAGRAVAARFAPERHLDRLEQILADATR